MRVAEMVGSGDEVSCETSVWGHAKEWIRVYGERTIYLLVARADQDGRCWMGSAATSLFVVVGGDNRDCRQGRQGPVNGHCIKVGW